MNIRTWNSDKTFVTKLIIKFYVIGASENIFKWKLINFFKKLCFEKSENIYVFWKGNKMKGSNKDAL